MDLNPGQGRDRISQRSFLFCRPNCTMGDLIPDSYSIVQFLLVSSVPQDAKFVSWRA